MTLRPSGKRPREPLSASPAPLPCTVGDGAKGIKLVHAMPEWLFGDSPGISMSGASGSGKSNTLEILLREVVRSPLAPGLLFIDPHGTSALKFYRWCLTQGSWITRRLLYLHFASTSKIPSIDVLHVPGTDIGSLAWYGRLAVITELVSRIILAAWGETDFNSKPILFKNAYRVIHTLAHAGLTLADAELFLNVLDPLYSTLCQAVPDVIPTARQEMEEIPDLRPQDRIAQIESFKNRTLGLLSNPKVKAIVSRTARDGAVTMQQLYDERRIVIVNLETGGVLRMMDQEILANVLLTLAIFTAMNTPDAYRHLQVLAVDELPVFRSSAELLTNVALPQCRKYLIRTIACFQGANAFVERTEDRLLQAFLGLCGTRLYFRHNSEADCAFFGRAIAMPSFSPLLRKYEHRQPMQFTEGNRLVVLTDTSDTASEGDTEGESEATGFSESDTRSDSTGSTSTGTRGVTRDSQDLLRETVSEARAAAQSRQTGQSQARGTSQEHSVSRSRTRSHTTGLTRKQQLVPIIRTRDIVTSVTFFTKEELDAMAASIIANLATGQAILHVAGTPPARVSFPYAADPYAKTPKFAKKKQAAHQLLQEQEPAFATIEEIEEQRQRLLHALLHRLTAIADGREVHDEPPLPTKPDEPPTHSPDTTDSF